MKENVTYSLFQDVSFFLETEKELSKAEKRSLDFLKEM